MKIIKTICIALVSLSVSGCVNGVSGLEQSFVEHDTMHLAVKGDIVLAYNPNNCQCAFSPSSAEFKVCEDNMKDYYILRCNRVPSEVGDNVKCDIEWTTYDNVKKRNNLDFKLVKSDQSSGTIWLWCSSARIGAAVRIL